MLHKSDLKSHRPAPAPSEDEFPVNMEASSFGLAILERVLIRSLQRLAVAANTLSVRLENASPPPSAPR